jgi:phosphoribosylformimino-5-aminoimidazole carboxamide ribotide isomerase
MLLMPAIDLRGGRCVRLRQGNFAAETRYPTDPSQLLGRYRKLGASWVHIVDLDGARNGTLENRSIIIALASQRSVNLQVGGGVRSPEAVSDLLDHGVSRVVIGSAAVERPGEVESWLTLFGAERICLAFDVHLDGRGEPRVHTRGWTENTGVILWDAINRFPPESVKHVLCTDIERDGALTGPGIELYRQAVTRFPRLAWQASGGVRGGTDLLALARVGVTATVSGKALLEDRMTLEELRPFLPDVSSPASTSAMAPS